MKKIVLTGLSALMLSVATAGAAEICTTCGSNTKVFFGVSAGMYGLNYDTSVDAIFGSGRLGQWIAERISGGAVPLEYAPKMNFPKNDTIIGMEAGMRFGGYKSIWNGGFTLSADKTLGRKTDVQAPEVMWSGMPARIKMILNDLKVSTNILSASFDNYIRLNKSLENRLDLIVGAGLADVETNIKLFGMGLSMDCHAALLRAGLELQLTDVISMTLDTRMYMPIASQYFDTSYVLKGGFKFSF